MLVQEPDVGKMEVVVAVWGMLVVVGTVVERVDTVVVEGVDIVVVEGVDIVVVVELRTLVQVLPPLFLA